MKYEYCGISLGDDIKDIINKFDISKIEYKDSMKRLYFKFGNFSKKTNLECFFSISQTYFRSTPCWYILLRQFYELP